MKYFKVDKVTKKFGGLTAVNDLSFRMEKGEILGVIGPNGSGKTTVFNLINQFHSLTAGEIYFRGNRIDNKSSNEICKLGIGRTFQVVKPLRRMTVLENVMAGAFLHTNNIKIARERAKEVLDFTGLYHRKDMAAKSLTIADRKRLEIARSLATEPKLLLLDETAAGLNPKETEAAIAVIDKIRDTGVTIIIVEHIMKVIMTISDKILAINNGARIIKGDPAEVAGHPQVIKAYLGDAYAKG